MSSIGIMDGAFFVGRKEIVDWINNTLSLNLSKVEETASGAVACQLFDIMHPNVVPMNKVNWAANKDFEYVANYKVLQASFTKMNIDKHVDTDRLIKGKYMDNLEFMQWFKRFFEMSVSDLGDYDAVAQRSKGKGGADYGAGKKGGAIAKPARVPMSKPAPAKREAAPVKKAAPAAAKENTAPQTASVKTAPSRVATSVPVKAAAPSSSEVTALKSANEGLNKQLAEMKLEMDGLVTERDFYFDKLRDVEMMLQELEDAGKGTELTASIFKILYATADGFESQDKPEGEAEAAPEAVAEVEVDAEVHAEADVLMPAPETVSAEEAETF
jgi:microtubule-associated protein, RP/EB family